MTLEKKNIKNKVIFQKPRLTTILVKKKIIHFDNYKRKLPLFDKKTGLLQNKMCSYANFLYEELE